MSYLEVNKLVKSFDTGTAVLKGISFTLEKGEVLSVIGASGNGKTTLLRCLNLLEIADSGSITVEENTVFPINTEKKENPNDGRTFGLVFQNFNLFPQYTALDNITLAMNTVSASQIAKTIKNRLERRKKIAQAKEENKQKAEALLARVGLTEKADFYPCMLSGGQQQRVAIARALALEPKILCFDEPTSALDPELTGEVLKVIRSLRDEGRTMIIVTHEMEFAKNVSDKVMFMADGVIEEIGTPAQIFDNPLNAKTQAFLSNTNK